MEKVRIFQFPIRNTNGGITHYAMNNWMRLDKNRFDCDFGTVSRRLDFADQILASGAGVKYISCYAEQDRNQFAKEMRDTLVSGRYDIVHLHTSFWKSFLVEEIAQECGIPKVIVHSHSTMVDIEDPVVRRTAEEVHWEKRREFSASMATDFWACSHMAADWLFGEQIPKSRIVIMKNAIDTDSFRFDPSVRRIYRQRLGLDNCFVIGHAGRFCYQKNHEFLLRAFADVRREREDARLLLIGSGALKREISRLAEELNVSDSVLFLGQRTDMPQLLQAMDVFCLPSRFEGLSVVLVEAQSTGLKCLVSDTVTRESGLTGNIRFLPLEEARWIDALLTMDTCYEREHARAEVAVAGYEIRRQIKEVERLYLA